MKSKLGSLLGLSAVLAAYVGDNNTKTARQSYFGAVAGVNMGPQLGKNIITIRRGTLTYRINAGNLNKWTPYGWQTIAQITKGFLDT